MPAKADVEIFAGRLPRNLASFGLREGVCRLILGAVSLETGLVWASGAWALAFPPSPLESPRIPSNPFLRHSGWNPAQRWGSPRDHLKPRKAPVTTKTAEIDAFLKDSLVLKAISHVSSETLLFRAWQAFCANGVFGLPPEVG